MDGFLVRLVATSAITILLIRGHLPSKTRSINTIHAVDPGSAGLLAVSVSDDLDRFLSVDSTIVRAHHHAAGARKGAVVPEDLSTTPNATGGPVELHESAT